MSNGFATGSARSVPGFDLYQAVESCSDLLENFGGHMYAAGLTMRPENVEEIHAQVQRLCRGDTSTRRCLFRRWISTRRTALLATSLPRSGADLNRFQPFGPGNTAPVFVDLRRQQPRRCQTGRRRVRTPAHGPDAAAKSPTRRSQCDRLPATDALRMDPHRDARSTYATQIVENHYRGIGNPPNSASRTSNRS